MILTERLTVCVDHSTICRLPELCAYIAWAVAAYHFITLGIQARVTLKDHRQKVQGHPLYNIAPVVTLCSRRWISGLPHM